MEKLKNIMVSMTVFALLISITVGIYSINKLI